MNDTTSIAWLGLDAHSKNCVLGQLDDRGTEVKSWSFATQPQQLIQRIKDIRHGRLGSQFVYEILLDADAPEAVAHIGLIDTAKLRHDYKTQMAGDTATLTGFPPGVAGQNGHLTAGDKITSPPKNSTPASLKPQPDGLTQMHIRCVPHRPPVAPLAP